MHTLDQLPLNKKARVNRVISSGLSTKLIEMGIYPGIEVQVIFKAPFGDPIAVDILGSILSLRKMEAALIELEP